MLPTVVTYVDAKMMDLAKEQAKNVTQFGLKHEIIEIPAVDEYDTNLWLRFVDLTMDAVKRHGKAMRLDAEVRLHKPLPQRWLDCDNVFFQPWPLIKYPVYHAMNTGHMIVGQSGLSFLKILRECMIASIPPDGDTKQPIAGHAAHIEEEFCSAIALKLSNVPYIHERLCYDRRLHANCAANRGLWLEENTILTHPTLHNWDWQGSGFDVIPGKIDPRVLINHITQDVDARSLDMLLKIMMDRIHNANFLKHILNQVNETEWQGFGWTFIPSQGLCKPDGKRSFKMLG